MNRIKNKSTISGDWLLAGGKIERVLKNALSELNQFVNILSIDVKKSLLSEDAEHVNIVEYSAVVGTQQVHGFGKCYILMYSHPDLKVLYSSYMRVYWSLS